MPSSVLNDSQLLKGVLSLVLLHLALRARVLHEVYDARSPASASSASSISRERSPCVSAGALAPRTRRPAALAQSRFAAKGRRASTTACRPLDMSNSRPARTRGARSSRSSIQSSASSQRRPHERLAHRVAALARLSRSLRRAAAWALAGAATSSPTSGPIWRPPAVDFGEREALRRLGDIRTLANEYAQAERTDGLRLDSAARAALLAFVVLLGLTLIRRRRRSARSTPSIVTPRDRPGAAACGASGASAATRAPTPSFEGTVYSYAFILIPIARSAHLVASVATRSHVALSVQAPR